MKQLEKRLEAREVLLVDGATGTMLMDLGLKPGECPELTSLTRPELLRDIARQYLDAGADILETNTFGASPMRLEHYGLADRAEAINRAAVRAVRDVVGKRAYVAGCCDPCGKLLKPHGDTDPGDVSIGFERQLEWLLDEGVDAIFVETMTDLTEASLAVRAAKHAAPTTPVMASMTFDATPRGFFTFMGVSIERAAITLREAGADVIGSNCGNGIRNMIAIAHGFRRWTDMPLIMQSNAGQPDVIGGVLKYDESAEYTGKQAMELLNAGVSVLGGCCGTTPEHTKALRAMIAAAG